MERQFGKFLLIAVTFAASVLVGCGGGKEGEASGTILDEDDFSDPESGWPTADDDRVLLEYADGGYRIVLRDPSRAHASWLYQVAEEQALTVEADAALRADPSGSKSREAWGIACSSEEPEGGQTGVSYFFYVASDGIWAIGREDPEAKAEEFIKQGEGGVERPAATHHLKAECVAHGDGRTTLAFAVNGKELTRTTDSDGPSHFTTIALHIRADGANTEVFFDNVTVRRGEAP